MNASEFLLFSLRCKVGDVFTYYFRNVLSGGRKYKIAGGSKIKFCYTKR